MNFTDNKTQFNLINTNARSLRPKIASFIQCFVNLSLTLAIVSETWFASGNALDLRAEGLLLGHGLRTFTLNRDPNHHGVAYGGVAIMLRDANTKASIFSFPNPEKYEILPLCIKIADVDRRLFAIAAYMPPGYTVPVGRNCLQYIADLVLTIKNRHADPLILVAGDFNQWDVGEALAEFSDIVEVSTPATRDDRKIDKIFTNWSEFIEEGGCLPPLQTEEIDGVVKKSDHNIQFLISRLPRKEPVVWHTFTHRPYTTAGEKNFMDEIAKQDWSQLLSLAGSNPKVDLLHGILSDLLDRHFPLKVSKKKSDDLPWMDDRARKLIRRKAAIYKSEGASARWQAARIGVEEYLEDRRERFLEKQRDRFIGPQAHVSFFRNVKAFKSPEKAKEFDVRELCPGKTDQEVANEIAGFFNAISGEFQPLSPDQVPFTYHRELPLLAEEEVMKMIKDAKKPKSMVQGDLFPTLFNAAAVYLKAPVTSIFNDIITTAIWPVSWKREYVTVIPKKGMPESFADLRNISCTPLLSKIFEGYMLGKLKEETAIKANQYGGVKGCSTTHMVVGLLQEMCENAEDYRSATILTAIDYSKAFNRVSFQHCLEALRKKGASTPVLKIIASFLTNRTMSVRVGSAWSDPLEVTGGCPQGSVLGVRLFNSTTDNLEDDFEELERRRLRIPRQDLPVSPPPNLVRGGEMTGTSTPEHNTRPLAAPECSPIGAGGFRHQDLHAQHRPTIPCRGLQQPVMLDPPSEDAVGTQVLVEKQVRVFKYVDDNIICEKLNFGTTTIANGERPTKTKLATSSQNAFRSISSNAEAIGMRVNASKTNILCVSDALSYTPLTYIHDEQGQRIDCKDNMRVLGFHFSSRPTVHLHVQETIKRMRQRSWFLRNLARIGFNEGELVRVYRSVILPIPDYCAPAYHSMLNDQQDQWLEQAQTEALRCIYGYGRSARSLRDSANLETLRARRIRLTDNFARKAAGDPRFCHWFPLRVAARNTRSQEKYEEKYAKCDRLKNSPLFYMRRRLNGKEGKTYGERNRIYRENFNVQE